MGLYIELNFVKALSMLSDWNCGFEELEEVLGLLNGASIAENYRKNTVRTNVFIIGFLIIKFLVFDFMKISASRQSYAICSVRHSTNRMSE